ncbi:hypothetical protein TIFTF001_024827 [Ficus carica]|uniref:Uncharacterized protein n=1 Tax=Ficus carica TaxID=3494 RepID=A0AA88AMQ5_FICCA|nr:hypothetical protein TIFTF001_024827 [Ficus carica]
MSLNFCELGNDINLDPLVFKDMFSLKFLLFRNQYCQDCTIRLNLPQGLQYIPDELRYLCWENYPLRSLPQNFIPEKLVELLLEDSKLEKLWDGIQNLGSLKILNLSQSEDLTEIPDLSLALNLEVLRLSCCDSLEHLPTSIGKLESLQSLYLSFCNKLKSLPTSICKLKSLKILDLEHCSKLEYFPEILEPMPNLRSLSLEHSGIRKLPASVANLVGIKILGVHNCKNLEFIPDTVCNLALLFLDLSNCSKLENLPGPLSNGMPLRSLDLSDTNVCQIPDNLFSYVTLLLGVNLSRTNIRRIPENIKFLKLSQLSIRDCKFLQSIPELPSTIREVDAWGCTSLEMVSNSMAVLTQPPIDDVRLRFSFEFSHSIKLKHQNIMPEFLKGASLIAAKFACQSCRTHKDEVGGIKMCYPGEEIPKWFNFQTEGRSMNIPYNPKSLFIGFAFCFIVKQPKRKEITYLKCEMNVKTIDGNEWKTRCDDVVSGRFHLENRKSLHVLMTTFMMANQMMSPTRANKVDFKRLLEQLYYVNVSPSGKELCEKIWSSNLDDWCKILWWQLVRDVLPVRAVLNDGGGTRCPLCGLGLETATHLFLFCDRVRPLWFMSEWGLRTDSLPCDSMASFLGIVSHGHPN